MTLATSEEASASPTALDRARQAGVTVTEILCIVGTLMGVGVIGRRIPESTGGALAADATHLAPAGPAFSIWTLIYLGLFAYTVWQWLPAQSTSPRHRAIGTAVGASMLLNATWLLVVQYGHLMTSVFVIVLLLAVLCRIVCLLERHPADSTAERVVTDGTFGLYLGWVSVATCANVAACLSGLGFRPSGMTADVLACGVLIVVAVVGIALARRLGARFAVAAAMAWGLAWLAYGRVADAPLSTVVAACAVIVAVVIVGGTVAVRLRRIRH